MSRESPVDRREALASILLLGGVAASALSGCVAEAGPPIPPPPDKENTGTTQQRFTEVDGFVFSDPPIGGGISDSTNLNDFFAYVNSSGKIGVLRPAPEGNPYKVTESLILPTYGGRVMGAGLTQTVFEAVGSFDVFILPNGARGVEISQFTVRAPDQYPPHVTFRILSTTANCDACYFHEISLEGVWAGFHAQNNGEWHTKGLTLENIIIKKRGYAIALIQTVDCRLKHVSSQHIWNSYYGSTSPELRDIWITGTGVGSNGGGCYMDHVSSRGEAKYGAYQGSIQPRNGIVIDNVLQLWGRHVAADNLAERGIWIKDCQEIFIEQGRSALCFQYCAVIETDPSLSRKTQVTLDSFFAGTAGTALLLIKRMEEVVIANSTFEQGVVADEITNIYFPTPAEAIRIDGCRNSTVSACTLDGFALNGVEGIIVTGTAHCTIANCQFKRIVGASSVDVSLSEYVCLSGNCFNGPNSDTAICINIGASLFCTVSSNLLQYHYAGVKLTSTNDVAITGNTMRGRGLPAQGNSGANGIEVNGTSQCNAITGNRITAFTTSVAQTGSGGQNNLVVGNNLAFNAAAPTIVNGVSGHVVANNKT